MKILVVDDSELNRTALVRMIRAEGFAACSATNGEEAFHRLCGERFDAVLTDYRMPTMGGLELTHTIRTLFGNRIRVIGVSSSDDCRDQFFQAGADLFLEKPLDRNELANVLALIARQAQCPIPTEH